MSRTGTMALSLPQLRTSRSGPGIVMRSFSRLARSVSSRISNLKRPSTRLTKRTYRSTMHYSPKKFTWGYEIEWGDVDRKVVIPEELGAWEFAETDILNIDPSSPYYRKAVDPLGLEPPVGGEINVKPTRTRLELVERVDVLKRLFPNPTASCVNHGHVHVFVPGLRDDVDALKRLTRYIKANQELATEHCYG